MAQVQADRRLLHENGVEPPVILMGQEFRAHTQRVGLGMAHAKHPLIPATRPYALTHLVKQSLKGEVMECITKN